MDVQADDQGLHLAYLMFLTFLIHVTGAGSPYECFVEIPFSRIAYLILTDTCA